MGTRRREHHRAPSFLSLFFIFFILFVMSTSIFLSSSQVGFYGRSASSGVQQQEEPPALQANFAKNLRAVSLVAEPAQMTRMHNSTSKLAPSKPSSQSAASRVPATPQDRQQAVRGADDLPESAQPQARVPATKLGLSQVRNKGKKHLCIGMAKDLLEEQLAVFAASFREHVPAEKADIVIFINEDIVGRMAELVDKYSVTTLFFNQSSLDPPAMRVYHPSTYRWVMIDDFLAEHSSEYDQVLAIDVRDSTFQADPFTSIITEDGLYISEDDPSITIGQCAWNRGWVEACFGDVVLSEVSDKPIYCSGVSLGRVPAMRQYTTLMKDKIMSPGFPGCEKNGVDQGMHNAFIHKNKIPNYHILKQASGPIANMQAKIGRVQGLPNNVMVVNHQNERYSIVHQYDRNSELAVALFNKYVYWDRTEGGKVCGDYKLTKGWDILKGQCDLKPAGGFDPNMCCKVCDHESSCNGFAHVGGVCWLKTCTEAPLPGHPDPAITTGIRVKKRP